MTPETTLTHLPQLELEIQPNDKCEHGKSSLIHAHEKVLTTKRHVVEKTPLQLTHGWFIISVMYLRRNGKKVDGEEYEYWSLVRGVASLSVTNVEG